MVLTHQYGGLSYRNGVTTQIFKTWKEAVDSYSQPEYHLLYYDNSTEFQWQVENVYSPAEKYDLLVGDLNYTLTNAMKEEGKSMDKDVNGDVPGWMGKCHGWSPAAINEERPNKTVILMEADGRTKIPFYPEDIEALGTAYWAEAEFETSHW